MNFDWNKAPKVYTEHCPICDGDPGAYIESEDRYGFDVESILCSRCGVVYLNPRLHPLGYEDFYSGAYRELVSTYWRKRIDSDSIRADQERYAKWVAQSLFSRLQAMRDGLQSFRILDVGGSCGYVAKAVAELVKSMRMDPVVCVVDPCEGELAKAAELGYLTVQGTVEKMIPNSESWDIILVCRTVDHLFDPLSTMQYIRGLMSPSGVMFADFVDWPRVMESEGLVNSLHIDHPFNFNGQSFCSLMSLAGFTGGPPRLSPSDLGVNSGVIEVASLFRKSDHPGGIRTPDLQCTMDRIRKVQTEERKRLVAKARSL